MSIQEIPIQKYKNGEIQNCQDFVAMEEPLEISLSIYENEIRSNRTISITMRTPGNDSELAAGFLFTEGVLQSMEQVESIHKENNNKILVSIKLGVVLNLDKLSRNFYTTSSCGVCGKSSIEAIRTISPNAHIENEKNEERIIPSKTISSLKEKINSHQSNFDQTGGIHASALFDLEGNLRTIFEDVGRHNALDKLIGHFFIKNESNLENYILLLSGRASFELIQKAAMAGIKIVCAIGAPSSLALEMAQEFSITLIGFLKDNSFNIYTNHYRII